MGSFKSPDRNVERLDQHLQVPVPGDVVKEGRQKFIPRPDRGLSPGSPDWQSEVLTTALTSHTRSSACRK